MRKLCAKFVPKVLTEVQKEVRVSRSEELLELNKKDPGFLNSTLIGEESWMFEYDPESKRQSSEGHTPSSPEPKKARMSKSRVKTMLIVFFDVRGIVHFEFVPQRQTLSAAFYLEALKRLKHRVARVRPHIKDVCKLQHDNAPSHMALEVTNYLTQSQTPMVPQPTYSPDLAPCDFFLFPRLKRELKRKHWESVGNIQAYVTRLLKGIPVEEFQGVFQAWQNRLCRCIDAGGGYFENFQPFVPIASRNLFSPENAHYFYNAPCMQK